MYAEMLGKVVVLMMIILYPFNTYMYMQNVDFIT